MQMATFTKATGKMTRQMAKARTFTWTAPSIRANGVTINKMDMELRLGQTVPVTRALICTGKSTEQAPSDGRITACLSENFIIITSTVRASTCGATAANMRATGRVTECTEAVPSHGVTAVGTLVSTTKIKRMATESSSGQMGVRTRVIG